MSDTNNTIKRKENQYHHLKENDRTVIQSLLEQKDSKGKRLFNNTYIALGKLLEKRFCEIK